MQYMVSSEVLSSSNERPTKLVMQRFKIVMDINSWDVYWGCRTDRGPPLKLIPLSLKSLMQNR